METYKALLEKEGASVDTTTDYYTAQSLVRSETEYTHFFIDYDLGNGLTGYDFFTWLIKARPNTIIKLYTCKDIADLPAEVQKHYIDKMDINKIKKTIQSY